MSTQAVLIIMAVVAGAGAAPPEVGAGRNATGDPAGLTLRLDSHASTYVLYEPVSITYTLTNPTELPIEAYIWIDLRHPELTIQYEDGEPQAFTYGGIACGLVGPPKLLGPGQFLTAHFEMFHNDASKSLAFPRLGRYTIHGEFSVTHLKKAVKIMAPPIQISVVDPREADRRLAEDLGSWQDLIGLQRRGSSAHCEGKPRAQCFEELRGLVRNHPDSAYAPHVLLDLAGTVGWRGINAAPQPDLEAELLEEFLARWPRHPAAIRASEKLPIALHEAGRERDAIEALDRFERSYPGRKDSIRFMRQTIQGIGGEP